MPCSNELTTLWKHFELMVIFIKDPDALAEAACRVNLISPDVIVQHDRISDAQIKTRSLLQCIQGKVTGQPRMFRLFIEVLRMLPGLSRLASYIQASYGEFTLA